MNRPAQHLDAEPVGGASERVIGEIWRDGGTFYQKTFAGPWELPFVSTFIEREDRSEILRFGLFLLDSGELAMPLLTSDGASPIEVAEARFMCFDEERYTIKHLLGLDDVEFLAVVRSFV